MCWWLLLGLLGCSSSSAPARPPGRDRDVLIEAPAGITVIYRDGDGDWQLAPPVGSRLGFDLESEHYAIAFLDVSTGSIESVYTTRAEQVDFTRSPATLEPPLHPATGSIAGLEDLGGTIAIGSHTQTLFGAFALEVPEGLHTIAAGKSGKPMFDGVKLSTLAVRRDVLIRGPLELDIDLDAEALPTTETQLEPHDCQYRSTYHFGDTAIPLGDIGGPTVISPHRTQWRAGDHLAVRLICRSADFQTTIFHSPGEIAEGIELAPSGGAGKLTGSDRWRFVWTPGERPEVYQGVIGAFPCDTTRLFSEEYAGACQQRWSVRVTPGWTGVTGANQLDVISPSELDAVGVWDPALELQLAAWSFESRRESVNVISRNVTVGTTLD